MAKKNKRKTPPTKSEKQKTFQRILSSEISKNLGFTEEELEPYWIEFRLMANKNDFLNQEGLKNMLSTLNVNHFFLLEFLVQIKRYKFLLI